MTEEASYDGDKKKTQPTWDSPKDARQNDGAGVYPNYYSHKTRSGHVFMMDDSNGSEHVTVQHRSGSMIQFMPDGAVQIVTHNGQYNIVFGENRMLVTGASDIVVQGDASLRVDGNYNVNVRGDTNFNINGDFNLSSKNFNQTIRGNVDVQAKNKTEKIEGSSTSQSQGATTIVSQAGMTVGSSSDSLALAAAKQVGILAKGGQLMMKSTGKATLWSSGNLVAIQGSPRVMINSGAHDDVESLFSQTKAKQPSKEPDTPVDV